MDTSLKASYWPQEEIQSTAVINCRTNTRQPCCPSARAPLPQWILDSEDRPLNKRPDQLPKPGSRRSAGLTDMVNQIKRLGCAVTEAHSEADYELVLRALRHVLRCA